MRKLVLAAMAALGLSAGAYAQPPESWTYAGMKGGAMGWETSMIARDAEAQTASTLRFLYFAEPPQTSGFNWVVQTIEFDCDANTFRLGDGTYFSEVRPGYLKGLDEDLPVSAGTPEYVLKRVLCDGATLGGTRQAANMADAMDGAERAALR